MKKKLLILMLVLVGLLALIAFRNSRQNGISKEASQVSKVSVVNGSSVVTRAENSETSPLPSQRDEGDTPILRVPGNPIPEEVTHAALYGAKARITLHVVDSKGNDVAGAEVTGSFAGTKNPAELYKVLTGPDGRVMLDAVHAGYMVNLSVRKENHYETRTEHHFNRRGWICVKDGRWIPWNPTLEVVLKEKRKPLPMYAKLVEVILPEQDKPFGYDMKIGDLVEPYGTGKYSDVVLTYFFNFPKDASSESISRLIVATSTPADGILFGSKDTWSDFKSPHEAPETGYETNLVLVTRYLDRKLAEKKEVSQNNYLIIRSRTEKDANNKMTKANYGKIYGELIYGGTEKNLKGGMVRLCYYFNPTPNDRNLEFDGKNNLFNPDWKDSWPREP